MSYRPLLLIVLGIACPLYGNAQIYKCATDASVTYQDVPCTRGQTAMSLSDTPIQIIESGRPPAPPPGPPAKDEASTVTGSLTLGMSDTEVLNSRGWGRPAKINRSKGSKGWREQWTYAPTVDGQRQLQFTNGKLTAINVEPIDGPQVVQITAQ